MAQISQDLAEELISTAHAMADAAGQAILPFFRSKGLSADNKLSEDFDPVTIADRNAEQAMREVLAQRRPDDAILGEEYGAQGGTSGLTWVLDPIDGTRGFLSGTPTWGTLIAVGDDDGPALGVVDQAYTGERFIGGLGTAEWTGPHGGGALHVRDTRALSDAILFTTFPEVGTPDERAAFDRVAARAKLVRYGMDCYAYVLLATGQIDLVIEAGLQAYDIQGPLAVIEAAGGIVTNWQGGPAHNGGQVIAAANSDIHAAAMALLSDQPQG
ncbi:histidinol-phosphatase [Tropicibacter naphthalenivorans]|uniref:Histidinol-phosphatase n=1 Tax=Tropicibacter naphthalenivorans TaxID=441103 RepID=A0A0P1G3E8_9RHOB|nr:histidinol-phosphatase [Tropicibacter naphthalenivorans]CUH76355.1 Histidinol-phosphatase [Tropicibacter naphthalenivorans]SMC66429.1 histidinol-phosphatase, inositol monophosphatase family [Tropicibacter naphthalenivorans]